MRFHQNLFNINILCLNWQCDSQQDKVSLPQGKTSARNKFKESFEMKFNEEGLRQWFLTGVPLQTKGPSKRVAHSFYAFQ